MKQILLHARLFDGNQFHAGKAVTLDEGLIDAIVDQHGSVGGYELHDLTGLVLAPGFVDTQVNGGGGVMLDGETSLEGLETITDAHRCFGTTTMLPTLISDQWPAMQHVSDLIKQAHRHWGENSSLAAIKGVHFEGPYLNTARKGVHLGSNIRPVDEGALDLLSHPDLGVRLITVAPEKVGPAFVRDLTKRGALVSAGHTAGSYQDIALALRNGLRGFTHLYNAMSPLGSREPGVVGAALDDEASWCGMIVDGFHVHPASMRLAIKSKPRGKIFLVTDAMASVGAKDKSFMLNDQTIQAKDGKCQLNDSTLAGSDLDMIGAVRNVVELLGLPLSEALRMASSYPAAFMRMDTSLGSVAPGFVADLVAFDPVGWRVKHTWINGYHRAH
ncbi:N-acetylglucosamine-6-phosphate deacetylase [Cohaesibacter celericrescens]|uniref:N-acetylglucosamine-6-phosphate deacetylase n=1 Tax=Cohaesibacter celericrescens TaxID=2067669 RepID=A0A2N5XV80_9HYPH|nr:N-acetylglucosamine-6-phosphate deacetylase [Cohaesibacter celericrescens]PLW78345.1 N-acetylglucosamine-6-phosphate deacetylase [Cohaesibacter celericrescens]